MEKLRIVSGLYKNRTLHSPAGRELRPTTTRVKQSLFNILQFSLSEKSFLDIFCGTGQVGLEAVSRGASIVVLVDKNTDLVQRNVGFLGCSNKTELIRGDFISVLEGLRRRGRSFDIIFADPPYEAGYYADIMKFAEGLLNKNGLLILEHDTSNRIKPENRLIKTDTREYGRRSLTFLKEASNENIDISGQL